MAKTPASGSTDEDLWLKPYGLQWFLQAFTDAGFAWLDERFDDPRNVLLDDYPEEMVEAALLDGLTFALTVTVRPDGEEGLRDSWADFGESPPLG